VKGQAWRISYVDWQISFAFKLTSGHGSWDVAENVSAHWLRHAHGSHALDRGATLAEVQTTLGDSNIATTSAYLHTRPDSSNGLKLDPGVFLR
jgi:site-specific recombinase XerD